MTASAAPSFSAPAASAAVLEPERQQRFADLAGEAAFRRQKDDFGELLSDRAAALDDLPGAQIGQCGARQPKGIDAEMVVETAILGCDHRFRQKRRHLLQ